jgi:hypothetical protein
MIVKPTDHWVNLLVKQFPLYFLSVIKMDVYPFWSYANKFPSSCIKMKTNKVV